MKYEDIIGFPHHQSAKHLHMSRRDRAAQFSPFAALTGYDSAVKETARLTDQRIELDEDEIVLLDEKLRWLQSKLASHPEVAITYFVPDGKKSGGAYITANGCVRRVRNFERDIVMEDGTVIPIDEIIEVEF